MENASKALVMAGGVLIGILILSLAVYLFADFGSTAAEINANNARQQIVEFNSKFTSYEGYYKIDSTGNKNWQITIYDIITLAGYAKENNEYYGALNNSHEEWISVIIINGSPPNNDISSSDNYVNLINGYIESTGNLKKFEYLGVELNSRGKVKTVSFKCL